MEPADAMHIIRGIEGVLDVTEMDDAITRTIDDEERSVTSMTGVDVVNEAYADVAKRDVRICIFCNNDMPLEHESSMTLEDKEGNILGMILKGEMINEYLDRNDVIWVSDDFIMFPKIEPKGGEVFKLKPMSFPYLNEDAGCYNVVMASPAPSSDLLLKRYFNHSATERTATLVVGYDRKSISP